MNKKIFIGIIKKYMWIIYKNKCKKLVITFKNCKVYYHIMKWK